MLVLWRCRGSLMELQAARKLTAFFRYNASPPWRRVTTPEPNIAGYEAYAELIAKPWIVDGVSPTEAAVLEDMKNLVQVEETRIGELLRFLVSMPFMDKISGVDQGIVADIREFLEQYRRRALEAFLDSDSSPQIGGYVCPG